MKVTRDIRRCALQALYQFDAIGVDEPDAILDTLSESHGDARVHRLGFDLAALAWEHHADADRVVQPHTPEWPTHRQPIIDRSILRLAYYEMMISDTPPKVAINEAVELAKEFGGEKSPMFINAVLDRLLRDLKQAGAIDPREMSDC